MKFVCLFITPQLNFLTPPLEIHNMLDAKTSIGDMHFYNKYRQLQIRRQRLNLKGLRQRLMVKA